MACDGGMPPASPTPTPRRARKSCANDCAAPHSAVMPPHTTAAAAIRLRRLWFTAQTAAGMLSVV